MNRDEFNKLTKGESILVKKFEEVSLYATQVYIGGRDILRFYYRAQMPWSDNDNYMYKVSIHNYPDQCGSCIINSSSNDIRSYNNGTYLSDALVSKFHLPIGKFITDFVYMKYKKNNVILSGSMEESPDLLKVAKDNRFRLVNKFHNENSNHNIYIYIKTRRGQNVK